MSSLHYEVGTISRGGQSVSDQWEENLTEDQKAIATAWTAAYRAGGELVKARGRTNIAAAGFSRKWQNALRVDVYPVSGISLRPKIRMWHKIPYAGVFEDGETIKGQPMLWLPVDGLQGHFGNERLTPLSFERATGQKLIPFKDPKTGTLLLGVSIKVNAKGPTKLSLTRLRRGEAGKKGVLQTVPVFVGIRQIHDPKKFDLHGVIVRTEPELPGLFERNMEAL